MRRLKGVRSRVVLSDDVLGADRPAWRVLHPGVTVSDWSDGSIAVWIRPYPDHPGGFLAKGRPQPAGDAYAHSLDQLLDLYDNEAIAAMELSDAAHVEALPYLVRVEALATEVRVQRLPGVLDDYACYSNEDGEVIADRQCWCDQA